jgi:hypothetical protein
MATTTTMSIKGVDLKGKHVVIKADVLRPDYRDIGNRIFLAKGGFGCSPTARGTAVFGTFVKDGNDDRMERYDIERLATDEEVQIAATKD